MEVITLYISGGVCEPDYSVWESDKAAAKFACTMIAEVIDNEWDLSMPDMLAEAKEINKFIAGGDYLEAVNYWNDSDVVSDRVYSHYYSIESTRIRKFGDAGSPEIMNLVPEDEQENLAMTTMANDDLLGLPRLIESGASCRTCHIPNEYATADQADGTYVCRGCKGMAAIFAGS